MTVNELIKQLKQLPEDKEVVVAQLGSFEVDRVKKVVYEKHTDLIYIE
jgi:hypothetical protein